MVQVQLGLGKVALLERWSYYRVVSGCKLLSSSNMRSPHSPLYKQYAKQLDEHEILLQTSSPFHIQCYKSIVCISHINGSCCLLLGVLDVINWTPKSTQLHGPHPTLLVRHSWTRTAISCTTSDHVCSQITNHLVLTRITAKRLICTEIRIISVYDHPLIKGTLINC